MLIKVYLKHTQGVDYIPINEDPFYCVMCRYQYKNSFRNTVFC